MLHQCKICGIHAVAHEGDICDACKKKAASIGSHQDNASPATRRRKILLDGGSQLEQEDDLYVEDTIPVEQAAERSETEDDAADNAVSAQENPVTQGIMKNVTTERLDQSFLAKWFASFFRGVPFSTGDQITMFQVFPSDSSQAFNAMGNACDQVIVYGKLNAATLAGNNDVEVYGYRDADNNVILKQIRNKATGTVAAPRNVIHTSVVRAVTIAAFAAVIGILFVCGSAISGMLSSLFGKG